MHGVHKYNTTYLASLDVSTIFDVPETSGALVEKMKYVHGWILAALLEEMKDRRDGSFEARECGGSHLRESSKFAVFVSDLTDEVPLAGSERRHHWL